VGCGGLEGARVNVKRRIGDRRGKPRFDVVGELWGTLEMVVGLAVRNASPAGALLESHVPLAPDSVHLLRLSGDERDTGTRVQVRHVNPAAAGASTYLIGVGFLSPAPSFARTVAARIASAPSGVDPAEA
jgi:hypothetical protein